MRSLKCLRCGAGMKFGMQQKFQLGKTGFLLGDWPNLLAGALELEVWFCPDCGQAWLDAECTRNTNLKAVILPMLIEEPEEPQEPETVGGNLAMGAELERAGVEFALTTDHEGCALWMLP